MKTMVIESYGSNAQFVQRRLNRPKPGKGFVLVRVAACSVNTADTKARQLGKALDFTPDLPAILGMDFSGWIEEVGEGVTQFRPGDEVYGCAGGVIGHGGALAEYLVADELLVSLKPLKLNMVEAAALPLVTITAWEALIDRMNARAGQSILIHGGGGGVGHVAIQIARSIGLNVFSTDTGATRLSNISALGATPIDFSTTPHEEYVHQYTNGCGFDLVFDTVGSDNIINAFRTARLNGQIATTVSLCSLDLSLAHLKGLSLHVIYMLIPMIHGVGRARHSQILSDAASLVDQGELRPIIDSVFRLSEVDAAYKKLESGHAVGKVVIKVD
jgi:NADPH:quinone reductase